MRFLFALTLTLPLWAVNLIDGLAAVVNNTPVTMIEVYQTAQITGVSNRQAVEMMIEKKLVEQEMERLGITVDDMELNEEIRKIAEKQGLTLFQFRNAIETQYGSYEEYEKELRNKIKKERFEDKLVRQELRTLDESVQQDYYDKNKEQFTEAGKIKVQKYYGPAPEIIQEAMNNIQGKHSMVQTETETIVLEELNPSLQKILNRTGIGEFTRILPVGQGFITFKILEKLDVKQLSFDESQNKVFSQLYHERKSDIIRERISRLKAAAEVKILRLPPERS